MSRLSLLSGPAASQFVIRRFESGRPAALQLTPRGWLHFQQAISVRQPEGKVVVRDAAYTYSMSSDADDEAANVFMYHYHREGYAVRPQSHYHICAERDGRSIRRLHFPTGRLSIEQILAHLLMDQKVAPITALDVALASLRLSHLRFMRHQRTDEPKFP
jgi:hypothetical protein